MRFTSVKPSYDIYLDIFKRLSNILFHLELCETMLQKHRQKQM